MLKTLYAEQKKRHRFIEQSFRLCGRRRGWDVSQVVFIFVLECIACHSFLYLFSIGERVILQADESTFIAMSIQLFFESLLSILSVSSYSDFLLYKANISGCHLVL